MAKIEDESTGLSETLREEGSSRELNFAGKRVALALPQETDDILSRRALRTENIERVILECSAANEAESIRFLEEALRAFEGLDTPEGTEKLFLQSIEQGVQKKLDGLAYISLKETLSASNSWSGPLVREMSRFFPGQKAGFLQAMLVPTYPKIRALLIEGLHRQGSEESSAEQVMLLEAALMKDITLGLAKLPPTAATALPLRVLLEKALAQQGYGEVNTSSEDIMQAFLRVNNRLISKEEPSIESRVAAITPEVVERVVEARRAVVPPPPVARPLIVPPTAQPIPVAAPPITPLPVPPQVVRAPIPERAPIIPAIPEEKGPSFRERLREKLEVFGRASQQIGKQAYRTALFAGLFLTLGNIEGDKQHRSMSPAGEALSSSIAQDLQQRDLLEGVNPSKSHNEEVKVPENLVIQDEIFVHAGSTLTYQDILFRLDRLAKQVFDEHHGQNLEEVERYHQTLRLLTSAKEQWPQAVKFQVIEEGGDLAIKPLNWQENVAVKEEIKSQTLIVGGELESITTAMQAADRGMQVVLLYAGPLGGLSADTGGNMRVFDANGKVAETEVQQRILHDALGMDSKNHTSLPSNIDGRLMSYLQKRYPNIRLVNTESYNSLHLKKASDNKISSILTQEGVHIEAVDTIDTDPELRVSEKAGLPMNVEMPRMAYGMVFDLKGLTEERVHEMNVVDKLKPEKIMALVGVSSDEIMKDPALEEKYKALQEGLGGNHITQIVNQYEAYGFVGLARAFDFYMQCLEIKAPSEQKEVLKELNERRSVNGFNITFREGEATLNSISYHYPKVVKQHDHNLYKDEQFADLREVEVPYLQKFMQSIGGKDLQVVMPHQLYVRQASASFTTLKKMQESDLGLEKPGDSLAMHYEIDVRGALPRDQYDTTLERIAHIKKGHETFYWKIDDQNAFTPIPHLYAVSKSAASAEMVGGQRILQNLIGTGFLLVNRIANKEANATYQQLMRSTVEEYAGIPGQKPGIFVMKTDGASKVELTDHGLAIEIGSDSE